MDTPLSLPHSVVIDPSVSVLFFVTLFCFTMPSVTTSVILDEISV